MTSPKFYTYVILDSRTDSPFYVGKGSGRRMYLHGSSQDNPRTRSRISEIKSSGFKLIYEKWFESDDEYFCYWMEIFIIDYFGKDNLCNMAPGGQGSTSGDDHPSKDPSFRAFMSSLHKGKVGPHSKFQKGISSGKNHPRFGTKYPDPWNKGKKMPEISGENHPRFGKTHSAESLQKMSESHKGSIPWNKGITLPEMSGKNHHMFGKHHSEEAREKMSISRTGKTAGENHPMFGKTHSEEARRKISEAKKGKPSWNSGKTLPEISGENHPMFGRHHSEESRRQMSESKKGKRTGVANHNFGKPMSEETKAKMIATKKARHEAKLLALL